MVESNQAALDEKLDKEWNALAQTQISTTEFLQQSVKRPLEEGNFVIFFNSKLVSTATLQAQEFLKLFSLGYQ